MRTSRETLVGAFEADLPDGAVVTDPDLLLPYRNDQASGAEAGQPVVAVFPRTTGQVQAVMRAAHARGVPVVPRGAGSGLSGGANATDGCVVLCLDRMDAIRDIRPADGYAVVEPGVINQRLRDAARTHDLWYAPDPASRDWCTIGGNIATNAGGLCCVKYGSTRDAVLGLEVVLADGRVTRIGRRGIKGVAGYDLVSLFVGSEGTLGVVTEARLRLRPLPAPPTTAIAVFPDLVSAGRAVESIMTVATPSLLELMDATTLAAVERFQPMGLDTSAAALLLAQSDLPGQAGEAEADAVVSVCEAAGATESYRSEDPVQADMLLGARRLAFPALERLGAWLLDDIAVPRSRLVETINGIERIAATRDVVIGTFGHAGDGNLHPMIVYPREDPDAGRRALAAFDDLLDLALKAGGTVSGEHGIGVIKRRVLADELDPVAQSLHDSIKQAFDPIGILNPGKALPLRP
ncbi:FAD-binding oxidoreductase [Candidatus Protofrankia californiensis]|uniref:FAD-binding oxidoreductase n=1 Tax=Candidatus Protofrankia californiensis TaxID=1839754 RepID=UPI00104163D3|nr:FAD-linked oxidase C-terminal domain-containing protein [Candidatus Protofrankia californiensis]